MDELYHASPMSINDIYMTEAQDYHAAPSSNLFPFSSLDHLDTLPHDNDDVVLNSDTQEGENWQTHGIQHTIFDMFGNAVPTINSQRHASSPRPNGYHSSVYSSTMHMDSPRPKKKSLSLAHSLSTHEHDTHDPNTSKHKHAVEALPHILQDDQSTEIAHMFGEKQLVPIEPPHMRVYLVGQPEHEHNDQTHSWSMLTREVFYDQFTASMEATAATQHATLRICNLSGLDYNICGAERINWSVQFLVEATQGQHYAASMFQKQQTGESLPSYAWRRQSLYDIAINAGRLFLQPSYQSHGLNAPTQNHFFSHDQPYYMVLQNFQKQLIPELYLNEPNKQHHNNGIYAAASVYFLLHFAKLLFATDANATQLYNSSQLLDSHAHQGNHQKYVCHVMQTLDEITQIYNEQIYQHYTSSSKKTMYSGSNWYDLQTLLAPKPWVILQVLQIRMDAECSLVDRLVLRVCGVLSCYTA